MPRRGGYKGARNWNQNSDRYNGNLYSDHDDRQTDRNVESRKDHIRKRVSFKTFNGGAGIRSNNNKMSKNWASSKAIQTYLEDDEDMVGGEHSSGITREVTNYRGNNKNIRITRRGSPIPKGSGGSFIGGKKKLIEGTSGWFLVTIPHGHKYDRQYIFKSLMELIRPNILIPHYVKTESTALTFYVDDIKVAQALLNVDRQVTYPDGFKMLIRVRNSIPQVTVDNALKEKMKLAMVKRYTAATKALDLTKFHADPDLREIFCALFRPNIMLLAIDIIAENIPDLEALKLDDNKIHLLDHLKKLSTKLPSLKILHLANNRINSLNALEALKECPLVDLVLQGNPFKDRMRDEVAYVSEVRKKFPKLLKLDGSDLPPMIGFDVTEDSKLPTPKASYLCDYAGAEIVRQFLEQYYNIFDSGDRQPLLAAYHENAMFSLTVTFAHQHNLRLTNYLPHNRNIMRIRDLDTKLRHLKNGRLPVVSFLTELPATQHDPQSFAVDLSIFTPSLIMLTVNGVFTEKGKGNTADSPVRSFSQTLIIVPSGTGFCIKNEMVHITNATMTQLKTAFKPAAPAAAAAPVVQPQVQQQLQAASITSPVAAPLPPDDATKLQMVQRMSQLSNMNLEWSTKCLEETTWDFDRAGYVFTELHKQNKIPPEAFVK